MDHLTPETKAQMALEARTIEEGLKRFQDRTMAKVKRSGFQAHGEVQKLIRGAVPILAKAIDDWIAVADAGKGRKPTGLKALKELETEKLAVITLTHLFRVVGDTGRIAAMTLAIGNGVEIELEGKALEQASPEAAKAILKLGQGDISKSSLEKRFRLLTEEHEAALHWDDKHKVLVGQQLLNVALTNLSDIFFSRTIWIGNVQQAVVELTDEAVEALVEMEDLSAMQHLPMKPMVAAPRKWERLTSGAYYDYRLMRLVPMVRTRSKEHRELLKASIEDGSMDEVLDALNAIQDTRWAIDTRVLKVVEWVRAANIRPSASFPTSDIPDVPEKVADEEWETMSQEERSARSRKRRAIREVRKALAVGDKTFKMDIGLANELSEHEAFYLPHSLDFRGRTYAVPYFNHQRSDHMKALFRFADGVALGEHGGKWLKIHLANNGDFRVPSGRKASKATFEERQAWVDENSDKIIACARSPEEHMDWWLNADSPFCFLQACFEYAEWASTGFSRHYLSHIPGAADGSCSGLQHYSAITRSYEEAYHVNLVPREDVGDIYQVTADQAAPQLRREAEEGDVSCKIILANGFGRSEVKRNVMTYFYGSAKFGMRGQHMQDLMRPLADKVAMGELEEHPYAQLTKRTNKETGEETWALDGGFSCARKLSEHVYSAVTTVAAKADEAANWVQQVAAVLAHESLSMIWRTQTGFPVVQRYSEYTSSEVNLWLYDGEVKVPTGTDRVDHEGNVLKRVRLLLRQAPTARVDKKTMRSASSPNVIHSMDAAHLHKSVAQAKGKGIHAFSMIHDSFGTHMGHMEEFSMTIRQAFVDCYEDYCPLKALDTYARSVLSDEGIDKLPPIPAKGSLDLEAILEAPFAFA